MDAKTRLGWIRLYEQIGNAGVVCRRCGISRPTLRKWWRRYRAEGKAGLADRSRRPHCSPQRRVFEREEGLILDLRRTRKLGIKRLRNALIRLHDLKLALDTIHKVLVRHGENRLPVRRRTKRKGTKRYSRPVPGDRVQIDVCKIESGLYQFTAIDDCSRYQVVRLYPHKTAECTLSFLEELIKAMPFPIQRIQSDRGHEFLAHKVQDWLKANHIKFRPIKPRSPHLNGKVERVQRTALEEFWAETDRKADGLEERLQAWVSFYNHERAHTSLAGRCPIDRIRACQNLIPTIEAVHAAFGEGPARHRSNNRYVWIAT